MSGGDRSETDGVHRRKFLAGSAGAVAVGLAGCSSGETTDTPGSTPTSGDETETTETVTTPADEGDVPEGGTFTYGMVQKPDSPNRTQASSVYTAVALDLVYDGPVASDPQTYEAQPWVYTDWEINNENFEYENPESGETEEVLEVRWNMRDDVKWGDGEDVTKEDILFSYDYLVENDVGEYSTINSNAVTDADGSPVIEEADGDWDFRGLFYPAYTWPFTTIGAIDLFPKHIWEGTDPRQYNPIDEGDRVVGIGPGELTTFDPATSMQVEIVNDSYREVLNQQEWVEEHPWLLAGGPFVDTFNFKILGSQSAMINAFLEGDIDTHYGSVPVAQRSEVESAEGKKMVSGKDSGFGYFGMNLRRKPLDDATFRQAMHMAWDERFWTETLQNNTVFAGDYPQSPGYLPGRPETYHEDAELLEAPETELYSFRSSSPGVVDVEAIRNFITSGKVATGSGGTYAGKEYPGTLFDDVEASQTGGARHDYSFGAVESDVLQDVNADKEIRIDGKTLPEVMDGGPIEIITDPPQDAPRQIKAVQNWVTNLRRVGIPAQTKVLSFNTIVDRAAYQQDYDIVELGWGGTSAYGASNYFFFHSNFATEGDEAYDYNGTGYGLVDAAGADELLQDAYTTLDTAEAAKKFAKSMEKVYLDGHYKAWTYAKMAWPMNEADWTGTVSGVVDPAYANWASIQANNLHKTE
jgi:peptide/nickel transport system substrate-binding protein